jgi:hypothetical protein
MKFVRFHIHTPAPETHTFSFQPQPLLDSVIAAQFDLAARAENALPRQAERAVQNTCHLPCVAG